MKIGLQSIKDAGVLTKERVVLRVDEDEDLGRYLVIQAFSTDPDKFAAIIRKSYWFPDEKVKKEDLVVLYTKEGASRKKHNADGTTSHFYYLGLSTPIWESQHDTVVLLRASDWVAKAMSDWPEEVASLEPRE